MEPINILTAQLLDMVRGAIEVSWWTGSRPLDIRESRDEVVASIKSALDKAGIEIPFPYRTLTFNDPVSINASQKAAD
ncbi:hypothetical protein [Marinobacter sp. LV10R510-11A]|uniref:hypothetical protein n=1 Tax=Marinobacter sp. LV10R510-11A TaxID=1415568 RepID=UPI0018D4EEBA|nr:hypothetical protein [Marinobacter sp. LV10R510-11A]